MAAVVERSVDSFVVGESFGKHNMAWMVGDQGRKKYFYPCATCRRRTKGATRVPVGYVRELFKKAAQARKNSALPQSQRCTSSVLVQ